jgi:alcohol dehydrogenase class IV
MMFKLVSPILPWREPELLEGPGSLLELPTKLTGRGIKKVLVVTDKSLVALGLLSPLLTEFAAQNIEYVVYDETVPNPTVGNIEAALKLYHSNQCQAIIACGGGSPIDCAKGVGARVARPRKSLASMKGVLKVLHRLPLLTAIPTTAGTGSEATLAAVISNPETHEKYPINDHSLIPHLAVLDPELTRKLPKQMTATTGMDALTHAVEAYIGRSNTKETERDAIEATRIIMQDLVAVYADGDDVVRRGNMLKAAYLAGKAFTRAYVGYVHAIAHTLGGFYGIPHGLANSVILPHMLDYFGASAEKRLADLARKSKTVDETLDDASAAKAFIARIRAMNKSMAIPETLTGIKSEDVPLMVKRALSEANPLYPVPRILNGQELTEVFGIISNGSIV